MRQHSSVRGGAVCVLQGAGRQSGSWAGRPRVTSPLLLGWLIARAQGCSAVGGAASGTALSSPLLSSPERHSMRVKRPSSSHRWTELRTESRGPGDPWLSSVKCRDLFLSWHSQCPRVPTRKLRVRIYPSVLPWAVRTTVLCPLFPSMSWGVKPFSFSGTKEQGVSWCHLPCWALAHRWPLWFLS